VKRAIFITLAVIFIFTACNTGNAPLPFVMEKEALGTRLEGNIISGIFYNGETLLLVNKEDFPDDFSDVSADYSQEVYIAGETENIPLYKTSDMDARRVYTGLYETAGGLFTLYSENQKLSIVKIDGFNFSEYDLGIETARAGAVYAASDGENIIAATRDKIYRIKPDNSVDEIPFENASVDYLCAGKDGEVYFLNHNLKKTAISVLAKNSIELSEIFSESSHSMINAITCQGGEVLAIDDVYLYEIRGKRKHKIMKRDDLGYTHNVANVSLIAGGFDYLDTKITYRNWDGELVKLTFSRGTAAPDERRVVTLTTAKNIPPDIVETIANINANINAGGGEFKIVIENINEDSAGFDEYKKAIASGNLGDIIIPPTANSAYIDKGIYADFYTLFDSEIGRDSFLPGILPALETDGKLFGLRKTFGVKTYLAPEKISPTFENILKLESKNVLPFYGSKDGTLRQLAEGNIGEFSAGDIRNMLLIADSQTSNSDSFFTYLYAENITDYLAVKAAAGEQSVAVGLAGKTPRVILSDGVFICINAASDKRADAFAAVKIILSDTGGLDTNFPVLISRFNDEIEEEINTERNVDYDGVRLRAASRDDFEEIAKMVENAAYHEPNTQAADIISEEASRFFDGNKNLDETVSGVMGRLEILYGEQLTN
jgi:hypothetical protein